jgi:hypothetical protein
MFNVYGKLVTVPNKKAPPTSVEGASVVKMEVQGGTFNLSLSAWGRAGFGTFRSAVAPWGCQDISGPNPSVFLDKQECKEQAQK